VRLAPGASLVAAQTEYFEAAAKLQPSYRLSGASGKAFMDVVVGDVRPALAVLTGAVALLLLIACVNVANLFLVRAGQRARELSLRRVLGASFWSTARQLIVESALLAVCGGILGTASAFALLRVLILFAPQQLPRLDMVRIDSAVIAIAVSITSLSVLVFGVVPALIAASASGEKTLRASSRTGIQTRLRTRLRDGLVASQVSLALVLLVMAGLLSRSLLALQGASLGYEANHLTIASIAWDATKSDTPAEILAMGRQMEERIQKIPGVQSVSPIVVPPFFGTNVWHGVFEAERGAEAGASSPMDAPIEIAGSAYFETMGIPIKQGRGFLESDGRGATNVVVISESVARHFWPKISALGNRLRFFSPDAAPEEWYTVVGVVSDTRFRSLRDSTAMVYRPWQQEEGWQGVFAIRSTRDVNLLAPHIREAARTVDPSIVLGDLRSMDSELSAPLSTPRLMALLLSAFGGIAFFLAAVGLYGVLASTVRDQTREIGIRSALGATPLKLVLAVVQHALLIAGVGAVVGMGFALALTRSLQSLLYETGPTDPITFVTVTAMLLVVAMISASAPALAAARVQPMAALRLE
jgi:predicted permease